MRHWQLFSWAIGLGALQAIAMGALFNDAVSAVLQISGMGLAIWKIKQQTRIFYFSWLIATAWLMGSVWWLHIALHDHGQLPALLSMSAIGLLCGGLALYYAFAMWIFNKYQDGLGTWEKALMLASCWTMAEMARAQWFTGFPWAAIGYAQINSLLSLSAPWIGVYGIGFLAVSMATCLAENRWTNRIQSAALVLMMLVLLVPVQRNSESDKTNISVALLQGNIPQDLKFTSARTEALLWYKEQSLASQADITVLPETALPYLRSELPENYWDELEKKFNGSMQMAIIGMLHRTESGYANSAVALGQHSEPSVYNKYHLVPFGEFTPYYFKWFTRMISLGFTDFVRGPDAAAPFKWKEHQLSVNICYEDVFGEELAKRFVQGRDSVPSVLVNISNIDWFGDTVVIPQHLNIARMRSLEFNRPSIRATNSGGTAIISAQGEIIHQLQPFTRGVLQGEISSLPKDITPYAYWAGHWGLKPLWLLCLGIMVCLIYIASKNRSANKAAQVENVK